MPLLPLRLQIQDDMPMSLGKAIAAAIKPQTDRFASFYTNTSVVLPNGAGTFISEDDCKQIKGAAKASTAAEKVGTARPLPEAAPPTAKFKVGDRVRLKSVSKHWQDLLVIGFPGGLVKVASMNPNETGTSWELDSLGRKCGGFFAENLELIPTPDAEGWVAHLTGAPRPVSPDAIVDCKILDGSISPAGPQRAAAWSWTRYVTAYRLVKP